MTAAPIRLGFVPLNDAAPLIVAQARGCFAAEGLAVELERQVSWATLRDKLALGVIDGAQMLGPAALAAALGLGGGHTAPLVAPLALNRGGPGVTLSARLVDALGPQPDAAALGRLVARRRAAGASPLTLAVVFPYSTHNYLLRDWLAAAGLEPDRDLRLTVAAPSRMNELLARAVVEGFAAGEPWNSAAEAAGAGRVVLRSAEAPDKVLAVREAWAEAHPGRLQALLRALARAAAWADQAENRHALAALLAREEHVGAPAPVIAAGLAGMRFSGRAARPDPADAEWLLRQMQRWGHAPADLDVAQAARRVYRADLHAAAAAHG
ncbi:ABC transporter substrate-binding protein [Phenylobacterium sp.]|jgi:NitT/TauT family transport system ATP-binding protein/nitrate/nitrite transport system substrate-binding protein|uniref:ABC transporter substrate-binding protein n=1 Tax=Phenylobacterium sp. TaxID=1871053 RepID=UPI002F94BC65